VTIPRPDWYFLFLFQLLKLGNEFVMSVIVVGAVVTVLVIWPFIDAIAGPRMAKRLGWKTWPVPGRNIITGTLWILGLAVVAILTVWALLGPNFCVPWFVNSPVCGA
jgi:quinol-cytochrome oxidoreductase complex cytochrome b subunit